MSTPLPIDIKGITFEPELDKFLLFGDSITQRCFSLEEGKYADSDKVFSFGAALTDLYKRRMDIVLRGYSGYCSEHARYLIDGIIQTTPNIKLATVFFGSNDASMWENQHVSIPRYKENTVYIVRKLKEAGSKVILIGPAPHDEVHRNQIFKGDPKDNPRSTKLNLEYSQAAKKVAEDENIPFVDLWHLFLEAVGWKEDQPVPGEFVTHEDLTKDTKIRHLLNDGLHFTGEGYKIMFDGVMTAIRETYPEFIPANIKFQYPDCGKHLWGAKISDTKAIFENKTLPEPSE